MIGLQFRCNPVGVSSMLSNGQTNQEDEGIFLFLLDPNTPLTKSMTVVVESEFSTKKKELYRL